MKSLIFILCILSLTLGGCGRPSAERDSEAEGNLPLFSATDSPADTPRPTRTAQAPTSIPAVIHTDTPTALSQPTTTQYLSETYDLPDLIASQPVTITQISKPFFKEFVVKCPAPVAEINQYLLDEWEIIGGYDLGRDYPHLADHMLIAVTEINTREEIDDLIAALEEIAS